MIGDPGDGPIDAAINAHDAKLQKFEDDYLESRRRGMSHKQAMKRATALEGIVVPLSHSDDANRMAASRGGARTGIRTGQLNKLAEAHTGIRTGGPLSDATGRGTNIRAKGPGGMFSKLGRAVTAGFPEVGAAGYQPAFYQDARTSPWKQFGNYAKNWGGKFIKSPLGKVGLGFAGGLGTGLMVNDIIDWREINDIRTADQRRAKFADNYGNIPTIRPEWLMSSEAEKEQEARDAYEFSIRNPSYGGTGENYVTDGPYAFKNMGPRRGIYDLHGPEAMIRHQEGTTYPPYEWSPSDGTPIVKEVVYPEKQEQPAWWDYSEWFGGN